MLALRVILGVVAGLGIPFGSLYLILHFGFNVGNAIAFGAASACGLIGAVYSAVAFARGIYGLRPFSILGYVLDMSWSFLHTTPSLIVWLPACAVAGGAFVPAGDKSRRSGTVVYAENPRDPTGIVFGATAIRHV